MKDYSALDQLIADNLASLLDEKGLKSTRLSQDAGMGRSAISDIIARNSGSPSYSTLVKIADAAGVDVTRITVGPGISQFSVEQIETLELLSKLDPSARNFLLNAAKAHVEGSDL